MTDRPSTPWTRSCPPPRLAALGLQHVLVMYAGAIAVPLIVGRALKLSPEQVALLISADLFCCGLVTLIQSLGIDALVRHQAAGDDGRDLRRRRPDGGLRQRACRASTARARSSAPSSAPASISMLIAPLMSRLLRFFPPVVTGTIIAIIGISLMRVGVGWAMGGPAPGAERRRAQAGGDGRRRPRPRPPAAVGAACKLPGPIPMVDNPAYGALDNMAIAAVVLVVILLLVKYAKGFIANISVLLGIVAGCVRGRRAWAR